MTLERFTDINSILTSVSKKDINDNKPNRECKIIKYLETLFSSTYQPGRNIAIDEGMMLFKGKMKNRVYNPKKTDKWGMKFYICACSETGYVLNLKICSEKCSINQTVVDLTSKLTGNNRRLYMDNWYNSFPSS
ncbi:PiggyBac transposable element-derived protein 4 [Cucumispora dikerogammari]|nr:PiggyBac transposable element-derived protein 4 [Cucumispora dikerogammari]